MMGKGKGMGLSPSVTPGYPRILFAGYVFNSGNFEKAFILESCTLRETHAVKHLYHA